MRYFIKLNFMALLYGFALFVVTELMGNSYRLERITHWFSLTFNKISVLVLFILFTTVLCFLTKKFFSKGKLRYILSILWIPYYVILVLLFSFLFPITNRGDDPVPALGLILLGMWIIYPFYIAIINFIFKKNKLRSR